MQKSPKTNKGTQVELGMNDLALADLPQPKFKTPYNSPYDPKKNGESSNAPSLTVPDKGMTVRDIIQRHARGLPLTGPANPIYGDDGSIPDLRTLDLAQIEALRDEAIMLNRKIELARKDRDEALAKKKREEDLIKLRKEIEQEIITRKKDDAPTA